MTTRKNKYNAQKVKADGYTFDSQAEHRRYEQLKLLERAREIAFLCVHPRYDLHVPTVCGGETKIGTYTADFTYTEAGTGKRIVEDVKSAPTARKEMYRWKKKHMAAEYGIEIQEVSA